MKNKRVLISGASISGPTLGYWLNKYGFDVLIVERSSKLRLGGQNIDVKGPAKEIAEKMGILEDIKANNTTEIGLRFVDKLDRTLAQFPVGDSLSMTQELEILRGDLVKILYDHTRDAIEYRFGEYITALSETLDDIVVTFASGKKETFDVVISAEGIGSNTRDLLFESKPNFNYLGLHTAYLTIDRKDIDSAWAKWHNAPKGIVFVLRPDNHGETRASITFLSDEDQYKGLSEEAKRNALIERIRGAGWESDRIITSLSTEEDLYFERVSQVKIAQWSKGRVAITGDAAWCATPLAGKGTDLAMAGAYILAGELATASNHQQAFEMYEKRMRPYVEACQKLPPGIPKLVYPKTVLGVAFLNKLFTVAGSKPVKWLMKFFTKGKKSYKKEMDLPHY